MLPQAQIVVRQELMKYVKFVILQGLAMMLLQITLPVGMVSAIVVQEVHANQALLMRTVDFVEPVVADHAQATKKALLVQVMMDVLMILTAVMFVNVKAMVTAIQKELAKMNVIPGQNVVTPWMCIAVTQGVTIGILFQAV